MESKEESKLSEDGQLLINRWREGKSVSYDELHHLTWLKRIQRDDNKRFRRMGFHVIYNRFKRTVHLVFVWYP